MTESSEFDILFFSENIMLDIFQGGAVVSLTLLAFIGLVWLREQILHGGGPEWLENELEDDPAPRVLGGGRAEEGAHHPPPGHDVAVDDGDNNGENDQDEDDDDADEDHEAPDLPDNLPAEPEPPEIEANEDPARVNAGDNQANDDGQWNPMEWDRAAEELTWERLLGLDGSLVFLEHVFWVVSLNTLFILVFGE